jgi:hypothetical protein
MSTADQDAEAFRRQVLMISPPVACPPAEPKIVQVLYLRHGDELMSPIRMQRATYFDTFCTVVVNGTSSPRTEHRVPVGSLKGMLRRLHQHAQEAETKVSPPLRFIKPVFDTRFGSALNLAHVLIDILPLCLHARRCIGSDVSFVIDNLGLRMGDRLARSMELLSVFAIEPVVTNRRVVGPIVHVRGTRGLAAFNLHDAFDCNGTALFPDIYDQYDFKRTVQYDKVFLARRDWRAIRNHSEVERLLKSHGYTTVYMEDFSILDQISIATHARDVVAIHGAAMAFLALSRSVDSVIELSPPHVYHSYYPVALGSKVRKYVLVIQEFDERVTHSGWHAILHFKTRPFEVNLRLLERALAEVR